MTDTWNQTLLEKELTLDEGKRYVKYKDTAVPPKWTQGIGHNLEASPQPQYPTKWTDAIIDAVFLRDTYTSVAKLDANIPWWRKLTPARQRVLINMCFNMGWGSLSGFHNTLAAIKAGQYQSAAAGMLASKWAKQVGARATRLAAMMRAG